MTKQELYTAIIAMQKECGQGTSGIVKTFGPPEVTTHMDELIAEGKIICCEAGGSLGHPESNRFYCPTKGYNVWLDGGTQHGHAGVYLHHVKHFLGIAPDAFEGERNEGYEEWLEKNKEALDEMMNLTDKLD